MEASRNRELPILSCENRLGSKNEFGRNDPQYGPDDIAVLTHRVFLAATVARRMVRGCFVAHEQHSSSLTERAAGYFDQALMMLFSSSEGRGE